ncbi:26S proteasome non-ATPase regulatory subunit 1-like protein [Trifolium pratense]|uniref:26S proteasome non-ATPase regulatory subunit 1-like protein n=1 Tax=Trifolium pratense TaxID=57577 RepID=A0A2K3KMX8_TRIPR|nr:26S proteasome non-ATPase regulatory subunit 1-like protein [Trifolium pratense]
MLGPAEKKSEPEPSFEILTNPARVVAALEKFIKFLQDDKYVSTKEKKSEPEHSFEILTNPARVDDKYVPLKLAPSGFVLLKDLRPTEPEVLAFIVRLHLLHQLPVDQDQDCRVLRQQ